MLIKCFTLLFLLFPCIWVKGQSFQVIKDTVYPASFRALSAVNDKVAWVGGSKGTVGKTTDGGLHWKFQKVLDSTLTEIRDIEAWDENTAIIMSITKPAEILKTHDGGLSWTKVYTSSHAESFLDGMCFWDKKKGIAYGDPIDGRFEIITTTDGGETWTKLDPNTCPQALADEASFASSGTGIFTGKNGKVWLATGGKASRIFYSTNYGHSWNYAESNILHGKTSTGTNSIYFLNNKIGLAVGGDFMQPADTDSNYAMTNDGGLRWDAVVGGKAPGGYRSCVVYIGHQRWIAVGINGMDISSDGGKNWEWLSGEGFHSIQASKGGKAIYLSGNKVIGRLVRQP